MRCCCRPREHPAHVLAIPPHAPAAPQSPNQLVQRRVYLVLHHVLKELASKRLAADQRNFEQVGSGGRWVGGSVWGGRGPGGGGEGITG